MIRAALVSAAAAAVALAGCGGGSPQAPPLAYVLARMQAAAGWRTLQATVVRWSDADVAARALDRTGEFRSTARLLRVIGCGGGDSPTSQVLADRPHRRVLIASGGRPRSVEAVDASRSWSREGGDWVLPDPPRPGDPRPQAGFGDLLATVGGVVAPGALARGLDLSVAGGQRLSGRSTIVLYGTPRPGSATRLWGDGANLVRLWVDPGTGAVLQLESLLDLRPFERVTLHGLTLNAPIPARRFAFAPPPGARVVHERDLVPRTVSARQAAASVPFTVFAPRALQGMDVWTQLGEPGRILRFQHGDAVDVYERSAPVRSCAGEAPPRTFAVGGTQAAVVRQGNGARVVRVVRDGTALDVVGREPPERLAEIAASLGAVR